MFAKILLVFSFFFLNTCTNESQLPASPPPITQRPTIFPKLEGEQLLQKLKEKYKPREVLGYGTCRDVLFKETARYHQDRLTCVYTGYAIWLDPKEDPSTNAYQKGINTEHVWPQSMGAKGQGKSDMHHLFPTREGVNSARSNYPFGEVVDEEADKWYLVDKIGGEMPTKNRDAYSELDTDFGVFEPKEDIKGDVARAMMYFQTMYNNQSGFNKNFFSKQKAVLLEWHKSDPVDAFEAHRNQFIAKYQSGKVNPFIEDATLAERAFGGND